MTTVANAIEDLNMLTPDFLRQCGIAAEGKAARILAELNAEPAYERTGRLISAAELLRARDTFFVRANQIETFGATTEDEEIMASVERDSGSHAKHEDPERG